MNHGTYPHGLFSDSPLSQKRCVCFSFRLRGLDNSFFIYSLKCICANGFCRQFRRFDHDRLQLAAFEEGIFPDRPDILSDGDCPELRIVPEGVIPDRCNFQCHPVDFDCCRDRECLKFAFL